MTELEQKAALLERTSREELMVMLASAWQKIKELEGKVADLERELAAALELV